MGERQARSHPAKRRDRDGALPESAFPRGGAHTRAQQAHWHACAERLLGFGNWTWDPNLDRMVWSDGLYALLGYDKASVFPNHHDFIAAFHPEDRPALLIRMETALDSGTGFALSARLVGKEATLRVRVAAEALQPKRNRLRKIEGTVQCEQAVLPALRESDEIAAHDEVLRSGERRAMEDRLRESETKFRAIYESNAVPLLFWHAGGRVLEANDACLRLIDRTREELAAGAIEWKVMAPELHAHMERALGESTDGTAAVIPPFETDIPTKRGRLPAVIGGAMFPDRRMGLAFLLDLSERKRAEEALRREQEFTRAVIDAATDAIFAFDCKLRYTLSNKGFERITGKSAQQVIGRSVFDVLSFLQQPGAQSDVHGALAGETRRRTGLHLVVPALGVDGYYDTCYSPLHGPGGDIIGGVGVMHDVTAQKRAEESLRLREQEFEAIAENSPDIVGRFDRTHRYVYLNRRVEALTGRPPHHFVGRTNRELGFTGDRADRWDELLDQVFATRQERAAEFVLRDLNGMERHFEWRLAPEEEQNEVRTVLAIARDITDRTRIEAELRQANRRLEAAMTELRERQRQIVQSEKLSALGTLAAGIAHELNNPMMGVMNYVDYAEHVASESNVRHVLGRAAHELERMRDLLRSMLAFARPMDEPPTEFDIASVVNRALTLMSPEFRARDIEVVTDFTPGLPRLRATAGLLQQVFVNLLMNARDALESSPRKRVHIRATRHDDHVRVDVTDSGRGVPPAIQDKIFDPFFTTKPPGRGTGLGLSISRTLMLEMGGDLFYRGSVEEGTTFSVVIPSASPEGDSQS